MNSSSDLKAKILAQAKQTPSLTRSAWRRRSVIVIALAFAISFVTFVVVHGVRPGGLNGGHYLERPLLLIIETSLGAGAVAAVSAWIVMVRGRSMLGRPMGWLVAVCLVAPLCLFGWKVLVSSSFEQMTLPWPERIGLKCLSLSVLFSLAPLLAFVWIRQGNSPVHPALTGAAMGSAAGGFGWVLVDLWCPVAFVPHLLLGHVLPMLALAGLGALLGWGLLRPPRS